jgi:ribonuclease D
MRRLAELGREAEAHSDFARIEQVAHPLRTFDPDAYYQIKDARALDGVGRRILRDLFVFREAIADREDRAVFRICPDHALLALAQKRPRHAGQLNRFRGLSDRFRQRSGRQLLELIAGAVERGPLDPPRARSSGQTQPFQLDGSLKKKYDRLRRWRTGRAVVRGVEPGRVIPNAMLLQVVLEEPRSTQELLKAGLEPWRVKEYGEELLIQLKP